MIEHIFPPEMMKERENQLFMALADCAGECYDINFTKDRVLGTPIQIVDGVEYSIHEQIGMPEHCPFTDVINYWSTKVSLEEKHEFLEFFNIENIKKRYADGERLISHRYWTKDVLGNTMLAVQKIRLYEDFTTGDLLGLTYVSDEKAYDDVLKSEAMLAEQYNAASVKLSVMEALATSVPAGYHRCGTGEGFPLLFVSDSFLDVVGWTREELRDELDNKFINLIAPEDMDFFMSHEPILKKNGRVDLTYRLRRKNGTYCWIQDATIRVEKGGEEYYQCTLSDITEYVDRLNEEKAKAEASSYAKSTFLFNASHDIRTPMNAILGFAHIIEQNSDNPQIVKDTIQKIIQSGDTLMTLLNDVLELSRIERGKDEVDEQPLNMNHHAEKLYEMFASEMKQEGINFIMDNDIPHPDVMGDDLKLTRIAMNLLSNAKKFTPQGGSVTFGIREKNYNGETADYCLFVRDTGIGMSKEFQKRAFEQFERERSSTDSGVAGSGLGLAIIEKICTLMNGECHIESELGKGTEITVSVPLKMSDEESSDIELTVGDVDFSGKRILIVEDNEFNREIARYILEGVNFIVDEAANGSICVDKLLKAEAGFYDLVLMDIQMPVMDGYTATKEIRNIEDKRIADIPIIAMTANAFLEDKQRCIDVGMDGHIGKPLDIKVLLQELSKILK